MVEVNVALVAVDSEPELVAISRGLADTVGETYVLNKNSLIHCTLAQFESADPESLRATLHPLVGRRMTLTLGSSYARKSRSGRLWFGIGVVPSSELLALQENVLSSLALPDAAFHAGVRERYFPHFSVGVDPTGSRDDATIPLDRAGAQVLCEVRVGVSGPQYQFEKSLF